MISHIWYDMIWCNIILIRENGSLLNWCDMMMWCIDLGLRTRVYGIFVLFVCFLADLLHFFLVWFVVFLLLSSVTNIVAQGPVRTHMFSLPPPPILNWPTQLVPPPFMSIYAPLVLCVCLLLVFMCISVHVRILLGRVYVCVSTCLFDWLVVWLIACLITCLITCLVAWLLGYLVAWLFGWPFTWLLVDLIVWLFDCLLLTLSPLSSAPPTIITLVRPSLWPYMCLSCPSIWYDMIWYDIPRTPEAPPQHRIE